MISAKPIRTLLLGTALALLAGAPGHAQYSGYEPPRWHVTGFAGISITHTTQSIVGQETETGQLFPVGDFRLNSDGFLLDPRFLHLNAGFDFQKGANTSERGDLSTGGINMALSGVFLPKSHVPLRASYTKSNHGVSGLGLDQTDDNSRLDVQWQVLFPSLPQINASFQEYGSTVHVPISFADRTYKEKAFNLGISDFWKDWHWAGHFSAGQGNSMGASQISLNGPFENSTRAAGFNLNRTFWENKARLQFDNREVWRQDHLGGDGTSDNNEFTNNVNFSVQLTPRLSLDTGYAFTRVGFEGTAFDNTVVPGGGPIQVLSLVSSTANALSGQLGYRPFRGLRLGQEVRSVRSTPAAGVLESRTSFTETASSVSGERRWRGLDLQGSYTGRFQVSGTTLERSPNSWSNSFIGRIGWGDARTVRLTASAQDIRLNLVEQIGGYTASKRVGAEAETHRVKYFRLRGSAEYSLVDLLNLSGNTRSKIVTYSAQAEQRLFTLTFTRSFLDGAGALFPLGLIDRQFLVIPLPISQLLATPLLNRTTRSQSLSAIGRLGRRLDVFFAWRTEDTQLVASDQTYDYLQASARYRLGKFSLEGGYSRNLNDVVVSASPAGNRLAMWYLRFGRDFKIF
ncbi:MAG: hypothetical protein LAN71_06715 [Acidobacteriia bacterium]|nr:hypothetical protein [Terriglobia bacterium]